MKVPVDQIVDVKVLIVLAKGVDQGLCHVEPAKVEDELEDPKDGDEHVVGCLVVPGGNHKDIVLFVLSLKSPGYCLLFVSTLSINKSQRMDNCNIITRPS